MMTESTSTEDQDGETVTEDEFEHLCIEALDYYIRDGLPVLFAATGLSTYARIIATMDPLSTAQSQELVGHRFIAMNASTNQPPDRIRSTMRSAEEALKRLNVMPPWVREPASLTVDRQPSVVHSEHDHRVVLISNDYFTRWQTYAFLVSHVGIELHRALEIQIREKTAHPGGLRAVQNRINDYQQMLGREVYSMDLRPEPSFPPVPLPPF